MHNVITPSMQAHSGVKQLVPSVCPTISQSVAQNIRMGYKRCTVAVMEKLTFLPFRSVPFPFLPFPFYVARTHPALTSLLLFFLHGTVVLSSLHCTVLAPAAILPALAHTLIHVHSDRVL